MRIIPVLSLAIAYALLSIPTNAAGNGWHNFSSGKARLAKIQQHRSTYLPRKYQTSNVVDFTAGFRKGAAWMVRSNNGVSGRIMTNVPTAGDPYTLWVIVFNNPSACDGPCDNPDIGKAAVRASVFNGTGAISADNGKGGGVVNMDFDILAGNVARDQFILVGDSDGLVRNKGLKAQILLIVDQHPPIMPGTDDWISDLTTTNFPGTGPVVSTAIGVFLPCTDESCPASVL